MKHTIDFYNCFCVLGHDLRRAICTLFAGHEFDIFRSYDSALKRRRILHGQSRNIVLSISHLTDTNRGWPRPSHIIALHKLKCRPNANEFTLWKTI